MKKENDLKITIMGDSNIATSMFCDLSGEMRRTTEINLITKLKEKTTWDITPYACLTIVRNKQNEPSYTEAIETAEGGDILFLQGTDNDQGLGTELGDKASHDIGTYYGALRAIAKKAKRKFNKVIFATDFQVTQDEKYAMFNNALRVVAKENGFGLIDFYNIDFFKVTEKNKNHLLPDNEHMSEEGLEKYADILIDHILKEGI